MRDERPIQLSPQDFENGGPSLEDQGYWRKKMTPLPRFLMREKDSIEKEEPSLSSSSASTKQKKYDSPKGYSSLWRSYKKTEESSSDSPNFSYQPMTRGRYVLVMTKLSMWTIAFSLFLLGVLFYLTGFFSALYLLSPHETGTVTSALGEKLGTFIDKIDHKSPPPSTGSPTSSVPHAVSSAAPVSQAIGNASLSSNTMTSPAPTSQEIVLPKKNIQTATPTPSVELQKPSPSQTAPAEEEKAPPSSYFMIQFGQFRTKDSAIKLTQELLLKGYSAKVFRSLDPTNKLWFYVRANTYPTRQAALEALQHLAPNEQQLFPLIVPSNLNQNTKIVFP